MRIFICGPTLYEKCHLGHARIFIFFNFLINFYRHIGYMPIALMQLTDIDHKIYQKESSKGTLTNITDSFLSFLFKDLDDLGIIQNFTYSRVSDFLPLIKSNAIDILNSKNGYSYSGNIYLRITNDVNSPFKLSPEELDEMPIDISEGKYTQRDIIIWNSENFYQNLKEKDFDSSIKQLLSSGIPGWHFQDHAVIKNVFNGNYDVHGGARELLYPHHEFIDEISKKVSDMSNILDKKWLHIGLLNNNSEKMSNSVGNTIIISNFLKKYNPNTLKLYFLSESYKNDINFSYADLDRFDKIDKDITLYLLSSNENSKKIVNLENTLIKKFLNFLYVDYDTKSAISFILDLLNDISNSFVVVWMLKILGLEYY